MKNVIVLGAGFSSLSAACYLAKAGYSVTLIEKHPQIGGRARQWKKQGFTFDMGPSFYWMPDVFESFFHDFGHSVADFYNLERLNPAYQVYFDTHESLEIPGSLEGIIQTFNDIDPGSGDLLSRFISNAESNYNLAINNLVYKPGEKLSEIITTETASKLGLFFRTIRSQVRGKFSHPWLQMILEFPVLFLGASASTTPAFYNFMNYADFGLGTWHPQGGMYSVVKGMECLAQKLGVTIHTGVEAQGLEVNQSQVIGVHTNKEFYPCDVLLSGADYAHTEQLLPHQYRQYSSSYWKKRTFAPSAIMFYIGFDKKLSGVSHHTLFFDTSFEAHSDAIYKSKKHVHDPLFYASFPSITDSLAAPEGQEAAVILVPLATDLEDSEEIRAAYLDNIIERLERRTNQSLKSHMLFSKSYGIQDFKTDYNAYGGNAYGLANTLLQTHVLRPKLKSAKLENMYFTGQLTVPGPGVPPSLISGKIVSNLISKYHG